MKIDPSSPTGGGWVNFHHHILYTLAVRRQRDMLIIYRENQRAAIWALIVNVDDDLLLVARFQFAGGRTEFRGDVFA